MVTWKWRWLRHSCYLSMWSGPLLWRRYTHSHTLKLNHTQNTKTHTINLRSDLWNHPLYFCHCKILIILWYLLLYSTSYLPSVVSVLNLTWNCSRHGNWPVTWHGPWPCSWHCVSMWYIRWHLTLTRNLTFCVWPGSWLYCAWLVTRHGVWHFASPCTCFCKLIHLELRQKHVVTVMSSRLSLSLSLSEGRGRDQRDSAVSFHWLARSWCSTSCHRPARLHPACQSQNSTHCRAYCGALQVHLN